eukprot:5145942-Pyramimonas_sp.AAC.1
MAQPMAQPMDDAPCGAAHGSRSSLRATWVAGTPGRFCRAMSDLCSPLVLAAGPRQRAVL